MIAQFHWNSVLVNLNRFQPLNVSSMMLSNVSPRCVFASDCFAKLGRAFSAVLHFQHTTERQIMSTGDQSRQWVDGSMPRGSPRFYLIVTYLLTPNIRSAIEYGFLVGRDTSLKRHMMIASSQSGPHKSLIDDIFIWFTELNKNLFTTAAVHKMKDCIQNVFFTQEIIFRRWRCHRVRRCVKIGLHKNVMKSAYILLETGDVDKSMLSPLRLSHCTVYLSSSILYQWLKFDLPTVVNSIFLYNNVLNENNILKMQKLRQTASRVFKCYSHLCVAKLNVVINSYRRTACIIDIKLTTLYNGRLVLLLLPHVISVFAAHMVAPDSAHLLLKFRPRTRKSNSWQTY